MSEGQPKGQILDTQFAERTFDERTNDQSNHLVEKAVAVEIEHYTRPTAAHAHRVNCPNRALLSFPAISSEAGKIMSANEVLGRCFQKFDIKWACDMPGAAIFEWRQHGARPDSVAIEFSFCRKARMPSRLSAEANRLSNDRRSR